MKHLESTLGGRVYVNTKGAGLWDRIKKSGRRFIKAATPVALGVAKELAPEVLSFGANKLLAKASEKGVPDFAVNLGSRATQAGLQKLKNAKGPAQTKNQKLVSDFITNNSGDLLASLLARGSGVRSVSHGMGIRNIGDGVRGTFHGGNITLREAPRQ